eukprot:tig00020960_g16559.t1
MFAGVQACIGAASIVPYFSARYRRVRCLANLSFASLLGCIFADRFLQGNENASWFLMLTFLGTAAFMHVTAFHAAILMLLGLAAFAGVSAVQIGSAADVVVLLVTPAFGAALLYICALTNEITDRHNFYRASLCGRAGRDIAASRERADALLAALLPAEIIRLWKAGGTGISRRFDDATSVFVEFPSIYDAQGWGYGDPAGTQRAVERLNALLARVEDLCRTHGLELVKLAGSKVLAVAGVPVESPCHVEAAAAFALDVLRLGREEGARVRAGLQCGPLVGGLLAGSRLRYDVWGDAVNAAARFCALCGDDEATVSAEFARRLAASPVGLLGLLELFTLREQLNDGSGSGSAAGPRRPTASGRSRQGAGTGAEGLAGWLREAGLPARRGGPFLRSLSNLSAASSASAASRREGGLGALGSGPSDVVAALEREAGEGHAVLHGEGGGAGGPVAPAAAGEAERESPDAYTYAEGGQSEGPLDDGDVDVEAPLEPAGPASKTGARAGAGAEAAVGCPPRPSLAGFLRALRKGTVLLTGPAAFLSAHGLPAGPAGPGPAAGAPAPAPASSSRYALSRLTLAFVDPAVERGFWRHRYAATRPRSAALVIVFLLYSAAWAGVGLHVGLPAGPGAWLRYVAQPVLIAAIAALTASPFHRRWPRTSVFFFFAALCGFGVNVSALARGRPYRVATFLFADALTVSFVFAAHPAARVPYALLALLIMLGAEVLSFPFDSLLYIICTFALCAMTMYGNGLAMRAGYLLHRTAQAARRTLVREKAALETLLRLCLPADVLRQLTRAHSLGEEGEEARTPGTEAAAAVARTTASHPRVAVCAAGE